MAWLLISTGICVLFVTQWGVAFLLRKVGVPVQLVVILPLQGGGGAGLMCTLHTPWPPVHKDCYVRGDYFFTQNKQ